MQIWASRKLAHPDEPWAAAGSSAHADRPVSALNTACADKLAAAIRTQDRTHRDAPQVVREALRLLCYSGILLEGVSGIRATRSEPGTRYIVNFGCNFVEDGEPIAYGARVRKGFTVRRMQEFGANHPSYRPLEEISLEDTIDSGNAALQARLQKSIDALDLTPFQKSKLNELNLSSIGDVLEAGEAKFRTLHYVGQVRSRQMHNAAMTAVIEYLSG